MTEKNEHLIAEARTIAKHSAVSLPDHADCLTRLADALEARQPSVIDRDVAIDAIVGGTISVPGGYGVLHGDDAANIVDAIIGQAAVPDAATEQYECAIPGHAGCKRVMVAGEPWFDHLPAERDAALAAIERVKGLLAPMRNRLGEYGEVPLRHAVSKTLELLAALDGAPEPEEKP